MDENVALDDGLVQLIKKGRTISLKELQDLTKEMDVKMVYVFGINEDGKPTSQYTGVLFDGVAEFVQADVSQYVKDIMEKGRG